MRSAGGLAGAPAWWQVLLCGPGPGMGRLALATLMFPGGPFLPEDTMANCSRFTKGSASPR